MRFLLPALALSLLLAPATACDLCPGQGPPLSQEFVQAKAVVFGPIVKANLGLDGISGSSELKIEAVLKEADFIKGKTTITLPRFTPPDAKIKYLIFLSTIQGQLDAYRVLSFQSDSSIVKYIQEAPPLVAGQTPAQRADRLLYFFRFMQHPEPSVNEDAFKEWANASNLEVGLASKKLGEADLKNLRSWLMDEKTSADRLALYAFLLGACGKGEDAALLRRLILKPEPRVQRAVDGLLSGYIMLDHEAGWELTRQIIKDDRRNFIERHGVFRLLRFYYGFKPAETKDLVLECLGLLVETDWFMDIAIDQLRLWKMWKHTKTVLAKYGTPKADAPISKRAIVRYALQCDLPEAKTFVAEVRKAEPNLVREVEMFLEFEKVP
jgi:hypothetical protein